MVGNTRPKVHLMISVGNLCCQCPMTPTATVCQASPMNNAMRFELTLTSACRSGHSRSYTYFHTNQVHVPSPAMPSYNSNAPSLDNQYPAGYIQDQTSNMPSLGMLCNPGIRTLVHLADFYPGIRSLNDTAPYDIQIQFCSNGKKRIKEPHTFDGKRDLVDYLHYFMIIAKLNG